MMTTTEVQEAFERIVSYAEDGVQMAEPPFQSPYIEYLQDVRRVRNFLKSLPITMRIFD